MSCTNYGFFPFYTIIQKYSTVCLIFVIIINFMWPQELPFFSGQPPPPLSGRATKKITFLRLPFSELSQDIILGSSKSFILKLLVI